MSSGLLSRRSARLIPTVAVAFACFALTHFFCLPVAAKEIWINVQTKNFNILSNAGEGDTRKLANRLEQFRYAFTQLFDIKAAAAAPVTVLVFKDDASFKPYKPLYKGKPTNIAGYFQRTSDQNLVALNINGNEVHPMSVIFHEYTHVLTGTMQRPLPIWFNEGLAELYSTFEAKNNSDVDLGKPIEEHVKLLRATPLIPFQTLFSIDTKSPAYNEREKQGIFYAESWALVHYLTLGDDRAHQPQLARFARLYESGVGAGEAFSEAFGQDFKTMEANLRAYVARPTFRYISITLNNPMGANEITVKPAHEADVRFYEGMLLLNTERTEEAVVLFNQAAAEPNSPRGYEGLGIVAIRAGNFGEAIQQLKQALDRDPKADNLTHFYYAEALWRAETSTGGRLKPETSTLVIQHLTSAIDLGPTFPNAYFMLGQAYLFAGEHLEDGVQAEKEAIRLDPENWRHYALALGQLQLRLQRFDEARRVLQPLAGDSDPEFSRRAREIVEMIDTYARNAEARSKRETQEGTPQPGSSTSPDQQHPRPTLHRRAEDSIPEDQANTTSSPETSGSAPARPTTFEGTQPMSGVVTAIECAKGAVSLVFRTDGDKVVRFSVSEATRLRIYSKTPVGDKIKCGTVNRSAIIHYKPIPGAGAESPGEAIAIEFKD